MELKSENWNYRTYDQTHVASKMSCTPREQAINVVYKHVTIVGYSYMCTSAWEYNNISSRVNRDVRSNPHACVHVNSSDRSETSYWFYTSPSSRQTFLRCFYLFIYFFRKQFIFASFIRLPFVCRRTIRV